MQNDNSSIDLLLWEKAVEIRTREMQGESSVVTISFGEQIEEEATPLSLQDVLKNFLESLSNPANKWFLVSITIMIIFFLTLVFFLSTISFRGGV